MQLAAAAFRLRCRGGLGASFSQLEHNQDRDCLLATAYGVRVTRHMSDRMNHLQRVYINSEDYTRSPLKLAPACKLFLTNISKGRAVQRRCHTKCDLHLFTDLAALVAGADPELVDLRFSHVGPLLGIVKLVLELPVLGHVAVGLLLLQTLLGVHELKTCSVYFKLYELPRDLRCGRWCGQEDRI